MVGCEQSAFAFSGSRPTASLNIRVQVQAVAVVRVLIDRRDQEHRQPQDIDKLMVNAREIASIRQAPGQPRGEPEIAGSTSRSTTTPPSGDKGPWMSRS